MAISACRPDRDPLAAILDVLAELISHRLPVNLARLYGEPASHDSTRASDAALAGRRPAAQGPGRCERRGFQGPRAAHAPSRHRRARSASTWASNPKTHRVARRRHERRSQRCTMLSPCRRARRSQQRGMTRLRSDPPLHARCTTRNEPRARHTRLSCAWPRRHRSHRQAPRISAQADRRTTRTEPAAAYRRRRSERDRAASRSLAGDQTRARSWLDRSRVPGVRGWIDRRCPGA